MVEFGDGITLFWGEIGSGKSTLLAALEFGLFGLGDIKNTHLLRHRAARGEVAVTFAAGGTEYTVHRALVRGARKGDVRQVEGWIEADGERTDYSTTELKARVLDLLGFNERPDPKAASRIYRYAVYTPQEEMKQVLLLGREERLDILRRAFGLEQYRHARRNVEEHLVRSVIAPRREVYAAEARGLPATEEEAGAARGRGRAPGRGAGRGRRRDRPDREERADLAEQAAPFAGARAAYDRAQGELAALERVIGADEAEAAGLRRELARLADEAGVTAATRSALRCARRGLRPVGGADGRAVPPPRGCGRTPGAGRGGPVPRGRDRARTRAARGAAGGAPGPARGGRPRSRARRGRGRGGRIEAEESRLEAALAPEAEVAEETGLYQRYRGTFQARVEAAEAEAERVLADAEALAAIGEGAACPTCRQTLTADHLAAIAADAEAEAGRVLAEAARAPGPPRRDRRGARPTRRAAAPLRAGPPRPRRSPRSAGRAGGAAARARAAPRRAGRRRRRVRRARRTARGRRLRRG